MSEEQQRMAELCPYHKNEFEVRILVLYKYSRTQSNLKVMHHHHHK